MRVADASEKSFKLVNFYVYPLKKVGLSFKKVDKVVPPWQTRLYGVIVSGGETNFRSKS